MTAPIPDCPAGKSTGTGRAPGRETAPSPVGDRRGARAREDAGRTPSPFPVGEGGPEAPAGGTTAAASVPPAGSRTFTIALPAGLKLLSLNGREHWSERARRTEALKKAAWAMTLKAKIPRLERVSIVVEYQPPDMRRRDAENTCAASGKAAIDGIVAAGVLEDDACPQYVAGIECIIGEVYPRGRLVLHLTEVAKAGEAA